MSTRERLAYYARLPLIWGMQVVHNSIGIVNVADILWLRPMQAGLLAAHHPFCTGIAPATGKPIWHSNIVFQSERREPRARSSVRAATSGPRESDHAIITRVGNFMRAMVARTVLSIEHPQGQPSRMPAAINYIHSSVHYNGGWLLFNDFAEAIEHFSDARFLAEFRRFVAEEQREPVMVFRQREYQERDFAELVCFLRSIMPWFSNSNGPTRRVLWGNPSPYATVNTITGNWIGDVRLLRTAEGRHLAPRPPIVPGKYFQAGPYRGWRSRPMLPERILAILTERRIRLRGARGNLYFVDQRKLRGTRREWHDLRERGA